MRVWLEVKLITIKVDNVLEGIGQGVTIYGEEGSYGSPSSVPLFPQAHKRSLFSLSSTHLPFPSPPQPGLPYQHSMHTQGESL